MELPPQVEDLLRARSTGSLATTMPDGSPQLTQVWGDTGGTDVLVDTMEPRRATGPRD